MKKKVLIFASLIATVLVALFLLTGLSSINSSSQAYGEEFCHKHQLPEKDCPWCNKKLVKELGWCGGHDMPEAFCYKCNSKLKAGFIAENDWCASHGLPESQCDLCKTSEPVKTIEDTEQDRPRIFKPPVQICKTSTVKVQLKSPEFATASGFEFLEAHKQKLTKSISRNSEIEYDRKKYARLSSPVVGKVEEIRIDLGQPVKKGDTLLVINSADVGRAKSEYLKAIAAVALCQSNYQRENELFKIKALEKKRILKTKNKLTEARIRLSQTMGTLNNLGYKKTHLDKIAKEEDTSPYLPLMAPFPGIILDYSATPGETVSPQHRVIEIADISRVWCMIELHDHDTSRIKKGQPVLFQLLSLESKKFPGEINWVSTQIDPRKRTFKARAELANTGDFLKAGMFGKTEITIDPKVDGYLVPKGAVQWDGCCNLVFVKKNDTTFEPRKITVHDEWQHNFVVHSGLQDGEMIVTKGSYLLKTEILKGNIGAGCCEEH
ncbi:MAG: efflux RND transporter periplasmic adaptor subunit [bacterium]|nr:efflux RND transporter periplasmic adaptor subunit [bacterium]